MKRRWSTRQDVWDSLNREYRFAVDLCADPDNAKCETFYLRENSLSLDWDGEGVGWLNPPYGREIGHWLEKAKNASRIIVTLVPTRTNAPWWHDVILNHAARLRFALHKLPFVEPNGHKGVAFTGHALAVFYPFGRRGYFDRWRYFDGRRQDGPICETWDWSAAVSAAAHQTGEGK